MSPAGSSQALSVGAQSAGRRIQLVLDQSDRNRILVLVDFAIADEFADQESIGRVAAVEGNPREAEGRVRSRGPFIPAISVC